MESTPPNNELLWDTLCQLGLPLIMTTTSLRPLVPSAEALAHTLEKAAHELTEGAPGDGAARRREAVEAMLLALEQHFPSFYRQRLATSTIITRCHPIEITGRHIKLRRIALARLAEYL